MVKTAKRRTPAQVKADKLASQCAQTACIGLSIDIMDLGKIAKAAEAAVKEGKSPGDVFIAARAVAESLHIQGHRVNR